MKGRLLELDSLRGLAAIAVVAYHFLYRFGQLYQPDWIVEWAYIGKLGVQFFFIVSGFVIYWTLDKTDRPMDFIVSRFSRLYPAYWFSVFLTFCLVGIFGLPGREVSVGQAFVNLLMIQEYLRVPHVDGVYWSLTVELTFYFWMFLFLVFGWMRAIPFVGLFLVVLNVTTEIGVLSLPRSLLIAFCVKYAPYFMYGLAVFKVVEKKAKAVDYVLIAGCVGSVFFMQPNVALFSLVSFAFFWGAVRGWFEVLKSKFLVFLGGLSYSLYLIHQNLGYIVLRKCSEAGFSQGLSVSFAFFFVLIVSFFLRKYIEFPSMRLIRRKYKEHLGLRSQ